MSIPPIRFSSNIQEQDQPRNRPPRSLEEATNLVIELQRKYSRIRREKSSQKVARVWRELQAAEHRAQKMNALAPNVTRQDVLNIQKLFSPPLNEQYVAEDGTVYYAPDSSHILKLFTSLPQRGEYAGYGIYKNRKIKDPSTGTIVPCDFVYCRKKEDQIQYERGALSYAAQLSDWLNRGIHLWDSHASQIRRRIEKQRKIAISEILPILNKEYNKWKYSGYLICTRPEDFLHLGETFKVSQEEADVVHGIFLFYKKDKKSGDQR